MSSTTSTLGRPSRGGPAPSLHRLVVGALLAVLSIAVPVDRPAEAAATVVASLDSIRLEMQPGEVAYDHFGFTLREQNSRTRFRARLQDWWPSEDGSQSFFRDPGSVSRSCGSWVSLNPVEQIVEPGKRMEIRLTIEVPRDAEPGGYWCVLTVDEMSDPMTIRPHGNSDSSPRMVFLTSMSQGIFIYVPPVERVARILDVDLQADRVGVRLENRGNAPIGVEGRVEFLVPSGGELITSVVIPRRTIVTEPVTTGILTAKLPDHQELPSGRYLVRVLLDIGLDHYIGVEKQVEVRREPTGSRPAL